MSGLLRHSFEKFFLCLSFYPCFPLFALCHTPTDKNDRCICCTERFFPFKSVVVFSPHGARRNATPASTNELCYDRGDQNGSHFAPPVPDPSVPCPRDTISHIAAAALELFAHELIVRLRVVAPAVVCKNQCERSLFVVTDKARMDAYACIIYFNSE